MYINYPEKFTVKVDYVHNILEYSINENRNKRKKNKNLNKDDTDDIYRLIDDEYAKEQTS